MVAAAWPRRLSWGNGKGRNRELVGDVNTTRFEVVRRAGFKFKGTHIPTYLA